MVADHLWHDSASKGARAKYHMHRVSKCTNFRGFRGIPYSTKHWWKKTLEDLAVDSRSTNLLFHHDFVQAL